MGNNQAAGTTSVEVEESTYTWTIRNFSMCSDVESRAFGSGEIMWNLAIYPRGRDKSLDERDQKLEIFVKKWTEDDERHLVVAKIDLLTPPATTESGFRWEAGNGAFLCFSTRRQDLLDRRDLFLPGDTLTIHCRVKASSLDDGAGMLPDQRVLESRESLVARGCLGTLSGDLKGLFGSGRCSDGVLRAGEKEFQVHRALLWVRAPVLAAMLEGGVDRPVVVEGVDAQVLEKVLQFVYCADVSSLPRNGKELQDVYRAADRFALPDLKRAARAVMASELNVDNVFEFVKIAHAHNDLELWERLQQYVRANDIASTARWAEFKDKNTSLCSRLLALHDEQEKADDEEDICE